MRKNQKGFTLVELIIAVAILAIVTLAVCGFIVVGSRSYTSANTDIMLQQEAQLALNQISDVIIDTTDSINYGNGTETVLKDSEFSSEPDEKILVVVNKKDGNNDNDSYRFEWSKDTETIYFNTSDTEIDDAHPEPDFDDANRAILAQHVKELHIDISQFEENRVVMISMTFENGNREYTTSNNVTVRNRIALNKIDVEPMKKAEEFTITTVKDVTLEPGDIFNLKEKTEVFTTSDDDKVIWELVDGGATSTISQDGQLSIGTDETRESFLVRVRRVNEEYANQNDKVAKTVKVNIKRVKSVDLSCSATTIKAGGTVTVDGIASGYMLGSSCEAHSCLTDDVSKDHDLAANRWRVVSGPATIGSSDKTSAEVAILSSAATGDEIVIEATSDLSVRKNYDDVTGNITLKVTQGSSGAIPIGSGFKFGTDNDPGPLDYMRSQLKTDWNRYVVCVRVREKDSPDASNDQIVMYYSTGANIRFNPDLFGLDLTRSYYVYFQVLDPVSIETRQKKESGAIAGYYEDDSAVIVTEYLNSCDFYTGEYIGKKYEADAFYYGLLEPPAIAIKYNGVNYPNDNGDYYETFSLLTKGGTVMGLPELADAINVERNTVLNSVKYSVYKGESSDPATWKQIYVFDGTKMDYVGPKKTPGGAIEVNPGSSQFLKNDFNTTDHWDLDIGTYYIIPGFVYANDPTIRGGYEYLYKSANIHGDYNAYYYEQTDCMITLKVTAGNLELKGDSVNGLTDFPVPTDPSFPFNASSNGDTTRWSFGVYSSSGQYITNLENINVKGTYYPTKDSYTIELYADEYTQGKVTINTSYGTYTCKVGGDKWECATVGTTIMKADWHGLIRFNLWGKDYMMEMPLPSDADFSVDKGTISRNIYEADSYGKSPTWDSPVNVSVTYTQSGTTYTMRIELWGASIGPWTCEENGTEWKSSN